MTRFYIRAARAFDRETVLRLSENAFAWGDYLPYVWDRWLHDGNGRLLAATIDRQPVAVAHVTMVADGEGWLEGLRVDPSRRRQGLATLMTRRCIVEIGKLGATVIRFATASTNEPVHRMAAGLGFSRVTVLSSYRAEAARTGPPLARPSAGDTGRLASFLKDSVVLAAMGGLCNSGWRFHTLTEAVLEDRVKKGMVRVLEQGSTIVALAMTAPAYRDDGLVVSFVHGQPEALSDLLQGLRAEAAAFDPPQVTAWVPELLPLQMVFAEAGFVRRGDGMWVFERPL